MISFFEIFVTKLHTIFLKNMTIFRWLLRNIKQSTFKQGKLDPFTTSITHYSVVGYLNNITMQVVLKKHYKNHSSLLFRYNRIFLFTTLLIVHTTNKINLWSYNFLGSDCCCCFSFLRTFFRWDSFSACCLCCQDNRIRWRNRFAQSCMELQNLENQISN